jgi:putative membrane protein
MKRFLGIKYTPNDLRLLFSFKSSLIKRLLKGLVYITAVTALLLYLEQKDIFHIQISNALPGYMGAALGLLLVFRNNTAYDKWWEARKELGALVNISRNFAIDINGFLPPGSKEKTKLATLLTCFIYALKEHLRNGVKMRDMQDLDEAEYRIIELAQHKPSAIANLIMARVETLWKEKMVTDVQQYLLVTKINTLIDICGKCERIRNTPIPIAYGLLLKFFINIYVILLPVGLSHDLGWGALPLEIILYYIMMSIVLTAEEIEEPFGKDLNDLPFDEMAGKMKVTIQEIISYE